MKSLFVLCALFLLGHASLSAQNTVTGTVTDKKGNLIPGAKVEIVGGTETTITELDGTFTLETQQPAKKVKVYYVGLQTKVQKVKPDMLVKMAENNWWKEKPDKYRWFAGVQIAVPDNDEFNPSYGLMLGRVKQVGWYVKGVYNKKQATVDGSSYDRNWWTTGEREASYWSATGGVVYRLWCPIHLYAGVGYFDRSVAWQALNGDYYDYSYDSYSGVAVELGLMLKIKRLFINAGTMKGYCLNGDYSGKKAFVGNFGVGMFF